MPSVSHRLLSDQSSTLILTSAVCEDFSVLHVGVAIVNKRIQKPTLDVYGDGVFYTVVIPESVKRLRKPQVYLSVGLEVLNVQKDSPIAPV